jgi:hypothetical protein
MPRLAAFEQENRAEDSTVEPDGDCLWVRQRRGANLLHSVGEGFCEAEFICEVWGVSVPNMVSRTSIVSRYSVCQWGHAHLTPTARACQYRDYIPITKIGNMC